MAAGSDAPAVARVVGGLVTSAADCYRAASLGRWEAACARALEAQRLANALVATMPPELINEMSVEGMGPRPSGGEQR